MLTTEAGTRGGDDEGIAATVSEARRQFHARRFLKVRPLPPTATDQAIRSLLHPLQIKEVQLNRVSETAKVTLSAPECLEAWPATSQYLLSGREVSVSPSSTEGVLCVAHLPLSYTDNDFRGLVGTHGAVTKCFLMRNETTGESKGYGFVEYASKDVAYQARDSLDRKVVDEFTICSDFLDSAHVTYSSLHSRCLFVDHLPPEYRDLIEFRQVFSAVVTPTYCQIALCNGLPLGFGLVEYERARDAETIQSIMTQQALCGQRIRVSFCIPGYRAMVLYNKLTTGQTSAPRKALLPNPPPNRSGYTSYGTVSSSRPGTDEWRVYHGRNARLRPPKPNADAFANCAPSSSSSNASSALVLLLSTELQTQMGVQQPSLLGNPQLLNKVQAILKQRDHEGRRKSPQPDLAPRASTNEPHKAPLLPNPPAPYKGALLPRPRLVSGQGALKDKQTGESSYCPTKVPLLGNKPGSVPNHRHVPQPPRPFHQGHALQQALLTQLQMQAGAVNFLLQMAGVGMTKVALPPVAFPVLPTPFPPPAPIVPPGVNQHPVVVSQLLAEIQQRGSVLGHFCNNTRMLTEVGPQPKKLRRF